MASLVPRLAAGSIFAERYRIVAYVGHGSMGSVYEAVPLAGGPSVALKIVQLDLARDPRALKRFQREVESGARIQSPHVVQTLDSGSLGASGLAWLAMEFVAGENLAEHVRAQAGLDAVAARQLLAQLFSALAAAHSVGIVHRDLKPENVLISTASEAPSLKVLDFGIARDFELNTFSGTTPGLGTPLWTAPEQTREGYRPVPNADVWALGLLSFFVLTGVIYWRHAGERASMADLALELLKSDIEPPSQRAEALGVAGTIPAGFDAWFERAVQRDPARRFNAAAEAWSALQPVLEARTAAPEVSARERATIVVKPGGFITVVILSVVGAGFAIYWLLRSMHI